MSNTTAPAGVKRGPGHRAVDARDAIAELTERAQEISLEAGSRVAIAMKDVISAAAGLAGFAVESARDLVQFMVRRGQMTPEEGDKLLRDAEVAHSKRPASERRRLTASEISARERAAARARAAAARDHAMLQHVARAPIKRSTSKRAARPSRASSRSPSRKPAKRASKTSKKSAKKRPKRR